MSPLVAIAVDTAKGTPLASAVGQLIGHLFEPGYNEFLLALITAAPFLAIAIFALFHLSAEQVNRGRWAGVVGAALTIWVLVAVRVSPASTASIGYIFLPFEVLIVMPIGYIGGRLAKYTHSQLRGRVPERPLRYRRGSDQSRER